MLAFAESSALVAELSAAEAEVEAAFAESSALVAELSAADAEVDACFR
ncbi:hypothetical protein [Actinobacillus arthritidis]|nr:hypothetical protein [Actinobacillus arthritidis]WGE88999.1 hypothetical protein NYR89_08030 [Actinobacillus arthritidis]